MFKKNRGYYKYYKFYYTHYIVCDACLNINSRTKYREIRIHVLSRNVIACI